MTLTHPLFKHWHISGQWHGKSPSIKAMKKNHNKRQNKNLAWLLLTKTNGQPHCQMWSAVHPSCRQPSWFQPVVWLASGRPPTRWGELEGFCQSLKLQNWQKKVNSHTQSQAGNSGAGDQVLFHWQVMFHIWICPAPVSDFSSLAAPHSYLRQWDTSWWNWLPLADLRVALKLRGMSDRGKGAESVSEIAFPDG